MSKSFNLLTSLVATLLLILLLTVTSHASSMGQVKVQTIVASQIATGAEAAVQPLGVQRTFHLYGTTSAGAGAATVTIEVSNDGTNWFVYDTLTLTLATTSSSDTGVMDAPYKYVRGNVTAISGTNATVSVIMGVQL